MSASESVRATTDNSADITNQGSITGRIAAEIDSDGASDNSGQDRLLGRVSRSRPVKLSNQRGINQSTSRTASFVATNETDRVARSRLAGGCNCANGWRHVGEGPDGLILIEVSDAIASTRTFRW